jgi:hypothetical protein
MKEEFCVYCNYQKGFDSKRECGMNHWGRYIYFGKKHRYNPFSKTELKKAEKEFLVAVKILKQLKCNTQ